MAEASISPLAVTTAPPMQSQPAPSPAKSSDAEGGSKFYQVLKERTANNSAKQSAKSSANGPDAARNQASAKAEGAAQDEAASSAGTHATLILMMDIPTQNIGGKGDADSGDGLTASTDETLLSGDANTLTSLSDAAAALAAIAAKLAGNSSRADQSRLETAAQEPDLTNRAGTQTDALGADPALLEATDAALLAAQAGRGGKTGAAESEQSFAAALNTAQDQAAHATTTHAASSTANQAPAPLPRHEVTTPVTSRNWADEVSQKVSWVATRDNGRAEIVLNPAHLGRIEVSINMNGEHATAAFVAANATAREALQDAMPRLREVLAQSGIQLGQTSVDAGTSGQAQADQQQQQASRGLASFSRYSGNSLPEPIVSSGSRFLNQAGNGMIDTFA